MKQFFWNFNIGNCFANGLQQYEIHIAVRIFFVVFQELKYRFNVIRSKVYLIKIL